jgi:putative resolvase
MKLSEYARKNSITYKTAWEHFKKGIIKNARQLASGTIVIDENTVMDKDTYNVVYARVSSSENKDNLDKQAQRLVQYCVANGWQVHEIIKEIGSGLNDNRLKLNKILTDKKATRIIIEHKDRLTRFGFNYIEFLCKNFGCEIHIVNNVNTDEQDLMQDFVSLVTSFCARLYGQRRSKRKTEALIESLKNDKNN